MMKKLLSLLLAIVFLFCFVSCGKPENSSSQMTGTTEFEKPEEYSATLNVKINPQFRLYLSSDYEVLALEGVNEDAREVAKSIAFMGNETLDSVIKSILAASKNAGFMKENANISFEIGEVKDEKLNSKNLLTKAKNYAETAISELKIKAEALAPALEEEKKEEAKPEETTSAVSSNTSSTTSKPAQSSKPTESSKPTQSNKETQSTPTHTHSYSAATCTKAPTCSCGAVGGKELGHKFSNGKCTVCGKEDTVAVDGNLKYGEDYIGKYTLNGAELTRIEVRAETDMEYIVFTTHYYTEVKPEEDATPFQYNGKTYYSEGGGHSPYLIELKDSEIWARDMNTSEVVAKFVLQSDGQLKATFCNTGHFVAGDLFKIGG